jgi:cytochrome c-type biogenesis protein CcmH/NrfG
VFAGFLAGYFVGAGRGNEDAPAQAAAAAPAVPATAPPAPPRPNPLEVMDRIKATRAILDQDPRNDKAWISLGNDYFDLQQARESVDAYAKALALAPDNPDVLTDQGIMYRQLKDYPRAIADFKQAGKLDPRHLQSLYNLGIVYADDLEQPQEALKAWNRILVIAPAGPLADQARAAITSHQQRP